MGSNPVGHPKRFEYIQDNLDFWGCGIIGNTAPLQGAVRGSIPRSSTKIHSFNSVGRAAAYGILCWISQVVYGNEFTKCNYKKNNKMLICNFCNKECKNNNSKINHERYCKQNPNRRISNFEKESFHNSVNKHPPGAKRSNQYIKARELGIDIPINPNKGKSIKGHPHTEEFKIRQSKLAKERGLGGVTPSRWIKYKGYTLGSTYELEVAKDLDKNNIKWKTCSRFKYIDPLGKERTYTPDFYLIDYDVYLDPKNDFLIENINPNLGFSDKEKIRLVCEQNNIRVLILNKNQLSWDYIKMLL